MSFKEVDVTCPICEKVKAINIPERIFFQKKFGNQYIAFVDVKGKVHLLKETDYGKIKISKEALLLNTQQHILQTPWQQKLKFEQDIVKKALESIDEVEQLLILQRNIANFIKEVEYTTEILENVKQIYEEALMEKLSKELMIPKINRYRINLIKEFIERIISPKLASKIVGDYFGYLKIISQKK